MADPANPLPNGHQATPADRVDPNVKLPPHVVAAMAAASAAHSATYAPGSVSPGDNPPPNGAQPNGTQPNGHAAPNGAQPNGQGELPLAPPELPETNTDGSVNWENRFKALKGRFEAEQRRWGETQAQFDQRIRETQAELERVARKPLPGEVEQGPLVTPAEVQEYGADLIDVIRRAAAEAVMPMLKPIATEVGQMRARVETTESETGKQFLTRMHSSMDSMVPGWDQLNRDPNFIAWTKKNDVYSNLNRQDLLQKAWYAGDSNRVAAFFQGYLAEEAATDPAAAAARQQAYGGANGGHAHPNGGPASPAPQAPARVTLEQLAAPGRARAATAVPAGKPVWTAEGIASFYQDIAAGKFRGRDAERIATETDLMSAQREGRIQINPRTATHLGG
jgi:hypothetical protein